MIEKTFLASDDTLNDAIAFVEEQLEAADCPMKLVMQITVCFEEMYVNVAHYAYNGDAGEVVVTADYQDGLFSIRLADKGFPFDPLAKADPDITLSAEERNIGGLGIYMVKKSMDVVNYEYRDGQNIFTMGKRF